MFIFTEAVDTAVLQFLPRPVESDNTYTRKAQGEKSETRGCSRPIGLEGTTQKK